MDVAVHASTKCQDEPQPGYTYNVVVVADSLAANPCRSMPKLYEYFGIVVLFYSNEHEPVHVHGRRQGRESKAELVIENGRVVRIEYAPVRGRRPLTAADQRHFQTLVEHFADEIVQKWIDYFVLHKPIESKKITERIG